jgi:hypothetical protein
MLATLLMGIDGILVTPQVVLAVATAFLITMKLPVRAEPAGSAPVHR